eukprot:COSAG03_NODE_50_length_16299_cov_20.189877_12_plen_67_part_01
MGAATVVAAFCYFQFAWSLLKLPWMFSFAAALGLGVQHGKVARMCHERGLAQGDVAPVSVTCWEHTI